MSGDLAARLVELYDELRRLTPDAVRDEQRFALDSLYGPADALRRAIAVDAPMLSGELEEKVKRTRQLISQTVP